MWLGGGGVGIVGHDGCTHRVNTCERCVPQLGAWDTNHAVAMNDTHTGNWHLSVALPKGQEFNYQYVVKSDESGSTPGVTTRSSARQKMKMETGIRRSVTLVCETASLSCIDVHLVGSTGLTRVCSGVHHVPHRPRKACNPWALPWLWPMLGNTPRSVPPPRAAKP